MKTFAGKIGVVTGGGTGMGRELVVQLAAEGCSVAACDVHEDTLAETVARATSEAPAGTQVTAHRCDVSDREAVGRFRDEVAERHGTDHVDLLFNNAGVAGANSFVTATEDEWERTFAVTWGGVYHCTRAFLPLLMASDDANLVNTSSVNGFWATLGPGIPNHCYSTAKFAVKGFTEGLIEDFRVNAPNIKVSVVMPGHIGTDIVANTRRYHGGSAPQDMTPEEIESARTQMSGRGFDTTSLGDEEIRMLVQAFADGFRDSAPLTAAQAATIILDGVRNDEWRILVGDDAKRLDERVRADPVDAYSLSLNLPI